jgi:hypothetical protein
MKRICLWMIMLLLLLSSLAQAATYYVATTGSDANPGTQAQPFRTIAKGIAIAAANGDTILLADGTYNEHNLDFGIKNLVLRSQSNNPAACILDCQQLSNGIFIRGGQTLATTVSGLTIRNAISHGNAFSGSFGSSTMYLTNSSATITNCIFTNNNSVGANGVLLASGSSAVITNCTFSSTIAQAGGGTTLAVRGNGATITNCIFSGNSCGSLELGSGNSTVTGCSFTGNSMNTGGGTVRAGGNTATLTNCTFTNNIAWYGAGIYQNGGDLLVSNCLFTGNYASNTDFGGGGGMSITAGGLTLANCLFAHNNAAQSNNRVYATCLQFEGGTNPKVVNCTFTGDWSNRTVATIVVFSANLTIVNSILRLATSMSMPVAPSRRPTPTCKVRLLGTITEPVVSAPTPNSSTLPLATIASNRPRPASTQAAPPFRACPPPTLTEGRAFWAMRRTWEPTSSGHPPLERGSWTKPWAMTQRETALPPLPTRRS